MAKPERDHRAIHTVLEKLHGRAVTQHVRRDAFAFQRRTPFRSPLRMRANNALDGIPAEPIAAIADEERLCLVASSLGEPVAQSLRAVLADRRRSLLAAFAHAPDVGARTEHD